MIPFSIRYRKHWHSLWFTTIEGEMPDKWSELNAVQLRAVASIQKGRSDEVSFLSEMLSVSKTIMKRTSPFERYKLMEYFEFLKTPKACSDFKVRFLCLKWSSIWKLRTLIFAPFDNLKGVTFGQFIFADTYFQLYQKDGNTTDLDKFIAALYLPHKAKFSEDLIQKNHWIVSKHDIDTREAIALNWVLIHEWLALAYPLIFMRKKEMETSDGDEEKPVADTNIWIKVFQNFVGDDVLHDQEWADKPINTIFQYMTRKYKENASK